MTQTIPITATPSQSLRITLGGQRCTILINQKDDGCVYLSLTADDASVLNSTICRDRVSLVRYAYLPFVGNLAFIDTQGSSDPDYTGFGARFKLAYIP